MAINENDSRVRRTKKLIRKSLTELAQEKSIDKITVKELTDHIDINRGTFYLHYSDIENLIECLKNEIHKSFCQILDGFTAERIKQEPDEILFEFCCFFKQNFDVYSILSVPEQSISFSDGIGKMLCEKCNEFLILICPDLSAEKHSLICEYFINGGLGLMRSWLKDFPNQSPKQISAIWLSMAKSGIIGILESETKGT